MVAFLIPPQVAWRPDSAQRGRGGGRPHRRSIRLEEWRARLVDTLVEQKLPERHVVRFYSTALDATLLLGRSLGKCGLCPLRERVSTRTLQNERKWAETGKSCQELRLQQPAPSQSCLHPCLPCEFVVILGEARLASHSVRSQSVPASTRVTAVAKLWSKRWDCQHAVCAG